jgi:hypothetical protein
MALLIAALSCVLSLIGSGSPFNQRASQDMRRAAEDDIREVVLRGQMEDWAKSGDKSEVDAKDQTEREVAAALNFKVFFVSINEKDPTDEFLKRFQNIPRTVKKVSESEISKKMRMPVVDKKTGELGIIFSADAIRWLNDHHVKAEAGYHCNGLCGAGYTVDLQLEKGQWRIKKERMNWIS